MAGEPCFAGVELGGTKCLCVLGTSPGDIRRQVRIATAGPEETLSRIETVLDEWRSEFAAIGVASFGPIELDRAANRYGFITSSPKPGWRDIDVAGRLAAHYGVSVGFSTDVNGAALAEREWGAAQGLDSLAYVTVGTGIGVGLLAEGRPIVGFSHPELGHLRPERAPDDAWPGCCPFHGACVEGLASGVAIEARTGRPAASLPADHPVWELVAHDLGQLLQAIVLAAAPRRIVMGGGVIGARPGLLALARHHLAAGLNHYVEPPDGFDAYVVPAALGELAGPLGALLLADRT